MTIVYAQTRKDAEEVVGIFVDARKRGEDVMCADVNIKTLDGEKISGKYCRAIDKKTRSTKRTLLVLNMARESAKKVVRDVKIKKITDY